MSESQSIESATTLLSAQPDSKTRRYDRQLRLWAASGQSALESARALVLGATATSTAILKNLVLPGIGHFTLADGVAVSGADAGANFFLAGGRASIGKDRAEEAVRCLRELNEEVDGCVVEGGRTVGEVLQDPTWVRSFTIVIAHNLEDDLLSRLAAMLWDGDDNDNEDTSTADPPPPLVVVRSAGFLAEFYVQFHHHTIIESHLEVAPTLRLSSPFPKLLEAALATPFESMDSTDHAHVPYPLILVRALETWRRTRHDSANNDIEGGIDTGTTAARNRRPLPSTPAEKEDLKRRVREMRRTPDEENFDEAEAQAWRVWTTGGVGGAGNAVPREIVELFGRAAAMLERMRVKKTRPLKDAGFYMLVAALQRFTQLEEYEGLLPLSGTVPDMKADTHRYIALQRLYKTQAEAEKTVFIGLLKDVLREHGEDLDVTPPPFGIDSSLIDIFLKNAHALRALDGRKWGTLDEDPQNLTAAFKAAQKETATHLALSAASRLRARGENVYEKALWEEAGKLVRPAGVNLEDMEDVAWALGEIARCPSSELPTTAAFLGGMVAQETIKVITKQYVPVKGYCVVDLIHPWTGVIDEQRN